MHVKKAHNIEPKNYYDTYLNSCNEGICLVCGNPTNFININQGYHKYCGCRCASISEDTKLKAAETCLQIYGNPKFKNTEKAKITTLERYGDANFRNVDKQKATCLERYGVESTLLVKEFQDKAKNTILEKYGVTTIAESPVIKSSIKQTMVQRYGGTGKQVKEFKQKAEETCKRLYGNAHFTNHDKSEQTKLLKYGDANFNNRDKAANTCKDRYGISNPSQLKEV